LLKFLNIRPWNHWDKFNHDLAQPIKNGRGANSAMKRLQVSLTRFRWFRVGSSLFPGYPEAGHAEAKKGRYLERQKTN
jgi:hypothetical protein